MKRVDPTKSVRSLLAPRTSTSEADPLPSLASLCTLAGLPLPASPETTTADLSRFLSLVGHLRDAPGVSAALEPTASLAVPGSVTFRDLREDRAASPSAAAPFTHLAGEGRVEKRTGLYVVGKQVVTKPSDE
ncbi:hypothetical protein H9P43_003850 [Blastocladiella emersonii ATCC 22665]|nr:hypothetical protein H9P43_003850 [Blastocladiella emersonii ATCC 22665]